MEENAREYKGAHQPLVSMPMYKRGKLATAEMVTRDTFSKSLEKLFLDLVSPFEVQ